MCPSHDVAVYAPFAGPLYRDPPGRSGGAELQMLYMAKALAARGLRVCHVVFEVPDLPKARDGIDLITRPVPRQRDRVHHYARYVWQSLAAADAAIYVQRTAGFDTGVVGGFARSHGRRFIVSTSWDGELTLDVPLTRRERLSYRLGLRVADRIVVQTEDQKRLAPRRLGGKLHVISSFAEVPPGAALEPTAFLWIGRVIDYKNPLAYLSLAEELPAARFQMIVTGAQDRWRGLHDQIVARARRLPNLDLLDPRPRGELAELYERAVAVVNTSHVEGFPNAFLEGWARGVPALSLNVDPDGVIRRHGLGEVADGSWERLASAARTMWEQSRSDDAIAARARRYVALHHSPQVVGGRWQALLEGLVEGLERDCGQHRQRP
jgi:glycosyltransferase involved in cell wall biosynthesis